ncbi:hypothetical protein HMPREF1863_00242 [Aedoeadaptatus coxii]|uniref:Uncharacterized protein n=1 Tax=Aedoeadaptatus coxii TaxID=755172 RepID=A0A134AKI9_9FIRM|nr:hypothetical protein HMPREF1863_00242 [Peptoniphilus coxii]
MHLLFLIDIIHQLEKIKTAFPNQRRKKDSGVCPSLLLRLKDN